MSSWRRPRCCAASARVYSIAPRNRGGRWISWRNKWWPPVWPRPGMKKPCFNCYGELGRIATWRARNSTKSWRSTSRGAGALLHRDGVGQRLRATRRARLTAITSGGAIADNADYQVILDPEGTLVGTLNEDFAIESNGGDIFQLGTASWRILRVSGGVVRVADARGAPPTIPFWLGEAPARTRELSAEISHLREQAAGGFELISAEIGEAAARQIADYASAGVSALGAVPTQRRVILERFFDESGGMQLVIHAPFGGRINRAWGLALRKRFCRGFGFELQAAANEEAIVLSLGPQHSFALEEVFDYLHPETAQDLLVQALLPAPMFKTRWRWNVARALLVERMRGGKRTPPPLVRMRYIL